MPSFLIFNAATILICIMLIVVIIGIVVFLVKRRKKGVNSCGCHTECIGCEGCATPKGVTKIDKTEK